MTWIGFLFLFSSLLFASPISLQKKTLRVPLNSSKRIDKALHRYVGKDKAKNFKNGDGLRRIGLNLAYIPLEEIVDYTQLVKAFDHAVATGKSTTNGLTSEDVRFLQFFSGIFNEEYYTKGTISGYENYSYRPELINPRVKAIIKHCDLGGGSKVLDVGCAFGYYVKALRGYGIDAEGLEVSSYALEQADTGTQKYLHLFSNLEIINKLQHKKFTLIILKDVLEHIPEEILPRFLFSIRRLGEKMLIVLPVTDEKGHYINDEDERDLTHVIRKDKKWWCSVLGGDYQMLDGLNRALKGDKAKGTLCALFSYKTTDILTELDERKQAIYTTETAL